MSTMDPQSAVDTLADIIGAHQRDPHRRLTLLPHELDAVAVLAAAQIAREASGITEADYQAAWESLTGRSDPWGGCADREAVERIAVRIHAARTASVLA